MNRFIFHKVGQGLFYSGHLSNNQYNFVFDCGSDSDKKFLHDAIDNHLPKKDIDFIVLSHLHRDHINGIARIIKNHKVKKISTISW